jgi:hypothetical protein
VEENKKRLGGKEMVRLPRNRKEIRRVKGRVGEDKGKKGKGVFFLALQFGLGRKE